jgi:hypothetical protein
VQFLVVQLAGAASAARRQQPLAVGDREGGTGNGLGEQGRAAGRLAATIMPDAVAVAYEAQQPEVSAVC